jgi:excisionase family DNA binding protein
VAALKTVKLTSTEAKVYDVEQARAVLRIGRNNFNRLLASGELKSIQIGRRRVVPVAAVDQFIARHMGDDHSAA